jgi:hypothetical protein
VRLRDHSADRAVWREFRAGRGVFEIASLAKLTVEDVEEILRDCLVNDPEAEPAVRTLLPDLPRCSAKTKGRGNSPCLGPATRPGGLCAAHFLRRHGHLPRYPKDGTWPPEVQFCELCGKQWHPKDRKMLQEHCPTKPPVPA